MIIGIAGLGLIGGSLAKAYKRDESCRVLGFDANETINEFALISDTIDETLTPDNRGSCDVLFVAVYPSGAKAFLKENAPYISKDTIVIDCLDIKKEICDFGFNLAKEYGFTFVGGHPMAGTHRAGLKFAREDRSKAS